MTQRSVIRSAVVMRGVARPVAGDCYATINLRSVHSRRPAVVHFHLTNVSKNEGRIKGRTSQWRIRKFVRGAQQHKRTSKS